MKNHKQEEESRRSFIQRLTQVLAYGGLTHFAFSKLANAGGLSTPGFISCPGGRSDNDDCKINSKGVETDRCPGGGPAEDVCLPEQNLRDDCPGERWPQDECPKSGDRAEDICTTGLSEADVCNPDILIEGKSTDQCPAQNASTDVCDVTKNHNFDVCWSGLPVDDECTPDGDSSTDECPGGGSARDTCTDGKGDACSTEVQEEDTQDNCDRLDVCGGSGGADVCYNGTNQKLSNLGGNDICIGLTSIYGDGSDTCLDGSEEQDCCGMFNAHDGHAEFDVCIATESGDKDDLCDPLRSNESGNVGSEDVCFQGLPSSDACGVNVGDEDECPQGRTPADVCNLNFSLSEDGDSDECPGGNASCDMCFLPSRADDECFASQGTAGEDSSWPEKCLGRDADVIE